MNLKELISGLRILDVVGPLTRSITGIESSSRKIKDGNLFVCVRGTSSDGHLFVREAVEAGAVGVLCEHLPETLCEGVTYVVVPDSGAVLGVLASRFFGNPSEKLKLVGVTGTNGKTTIATLLYNMFRRMGHKVGLLSTVCNYIDARPVPATHTTPDPVTLNSLLAEMVEEGCEYAFMEVSSHAVVQHRIAGLSFVGGIFTNLTRDHLDYHKTMEEYLKAKKTFFDKLPQGSFVLTNLDDKNGTVMVQNTQSDVKTYSVRNMCDFKGRILESHFDGMVMDICGRETAVQFVGRFNASNLLAVFGTAVMLGKDPDEVLRVLSILTPVSGRFESVRLPDGCTAIVDYAHTPDAISGVLGAIHEVLGGRGRVITVVGAGGNRDKGKRPLMAKEAVKGSDFVVITSDNPRYEDPAEIIRDMQEGLTPEERTRVLSITDRREAIRAVLMMAKKEDVVLVAGKGHEDYQEIAGVRYHFDDKEEIIEAGKGRVASESK